MASWVFPKGHRIRIAVSNALWPMMWPTPYPMTTTLVTGGMGGTGASRIVLPRVPARGATASAFARPEPVEKPAGITEGAGAWPGEWTVAHDDAHRHTTVIWKGHTAVSYPWGRFDHSERLTYDIDDAHPDGASVQGDSNYDQEAHGHLLTWRARNAAKSVTSRPATSCPSERYTTLSGGCVRRHPGLLAGDRLPRERLPISG